MASIRKLPTGRFQALWRDPQRVQHSKNFIRKRDAELFLDQIRGELVRNAYVDPQASRETFQSYAERWRTQQPHRPSTRLLYQRTLARHVYPRIGDIPIGAVRRTDIQSLVSQASDRGLAPKSIENIHRLVAAVFNHAVDDGLISRSPCRRVALPRPEQRQFVPLSAEQIWSIVGALPDRFRALALLMAGSGLRQGEALGLTVDHVDFLRRRLSVQQQLIDLPRTARYLGPPKTVQSRRTVPLPDVVLDSLSAHLETYGTGEWNLVFTTRRGLAIPRASWYRSWTEARKEAGLPAGTTVHLLRHTYASALIQAGESVKTVQERLGHATPMETLNTYLHLWPDNEDRTRRVMQLALATPPAGGERRSAEADRGSAEQ